MMEWSDEQEQELRRLVTQGLSSSAIARSLGAGLTRNAVIGKITRLKLERPGRTKPIVKKRRPQPVIDKDHVERLRAERLPVQIEPVTTSEVPVEARADAVPLLELKQGDCRWPFEGGGFCGKEAVRGQPYCEGHSQMAFRGYK